MVGVEYVIGRKVSFLASTASPKSRPVRPRRRIELVRLSPPHSDFTPKSAHHPLLLSLLVVDEPKFLVPMATRSVFSRLAPTLRRTPASTSFAARRVVLARGYASESEHHVSLCSQPLYTVTRLELMVFCDYVELLIR